MIGVIFQTHNPRSKTLGKNVLGSVLARVVSICVSLFLVPITINFVSSELYGVWLTLSSIIIWLGFFDVGFTLGLKNKLTEAIAQKNNSKARALVSTTYLLMILIFIPLMIILYFIIPHVNWCSFLNVDSIYENMIVTTMRIVCSCFCAQMIVGIIGTILMAYQETALNAILLSLGNLFSFLIILVLVKYASPSLVYLALSISMVPILIYVTSSFIFFNGRFREVRPSLKLSNFEYAKDIFGLSYKFFIIQVQGIILVHFTNFLISNISGPNDVTHYNIAQKYLSVGLMFYNILLGPLWPAITDAYALSDYDWLKNVYRKMSVIYSITVVLILAMIALSSIAYHIWLKDSVSVPMSMTILVGIYTIINTWVNFQASFLNGLGKIKVQTVGACIGLVVHIPLAYLLAKNFNAYGVLISMIIINILYTLLYTYQNLNIISRRAKGIWNQ